MEHRPPQTQHQLSEQERDTPSLDPVDLLMERIGRGARFHRELSDWVADGATVVPQLTNDQAATYGPVFAARMSVVVEVWRKRDQGRTSQMLSDAIIGLLRAMQEAAAEPIRLTYVKPTSSGPGPDTLEACVPAGR